MTTHTITLADDKQATITVDEFGAGRPLLLLHGGAGSQSMTGFAQRLAAIPTAEFHLLSNTGHMPQIETPEQVLTAVWNCADARSRTQSTIG